MPARAAAREGFTTPRPPPPAQCAGMSRSYGAAQARHRLPAVARRCGWLRSRLPLASVGPASPGCGPLARRAGKGGDTARQDGPESPRTDRPSRDVGCRAWPGSTRRQLRPPAPLTLSAAGSGRTSSAQPAGTAGQQSLCSRPRRGAPPPRLCAPSSGAQAPSFCGCAARSSGTRAPCAVPAVHEPCPGHRVHNAGLPFSSLLTSP